MTVLPDELFSDLIWTALETEHTRFAIARSLARRYAADVAPFAAIAEPSQAALDDLAALLTTPADSVWLFHDSLPAHPALKVLGPLPCFRMAFPADLPIPPPARNDIVKLTAADADEMVALTDIAFPGFYRRRTVQMGAYFGIRDDTGQLISMCGERVAVPGHAEASGLCTHPEHRGKGYGEALLWQVLRRQREAGVMNFCHVTTVNASAIALYRRMGFVMVGEVPLLRVARSSR